MAAIRRPAIGRSPVGAARAPSSRALATLLEGAGPIVLWSASRSAARDAPAALIVTRLRSAGHTLRGHASAASARRRSTGPAPRRTRHPAAAVDRELGAGSWSYFGDPRAISHDGHTFTGWISTTGNVWVARYTAAASSPSALIFRGLGRDDHNNPSLVFRRDGQSWCSSRRTRATTCRRPGSPSVMRYMVSLHPYSIEGFGRVRTVDQRAGRTRLHLSEPDPAAGQAVALLARRRLESDLLLHRGRHRTGCRRASSSTSAAAQRPYAKYVGDGNRRIHAIFTDGHPAATGRTASTTCATRPGALHRGRAPARDAGARAAAHVKARPHLQVLRRRRAGVAARHRADRRGPAARRLHPPRRRPRHVLLRVPQRHEWISRKIVEAGAGRTSFTSGGATLDHEDPRFVYLSRTIGHWNQVEQWFTPDEGRTWSTRQLTADPTASASARSRRAGSRGANRVLYVWGDERTTASPTTSPASTRSTSRREAAPLSPPSRRGAAAARGRRARSPCGATRRPGRGRR